jgi:hypothetical protein
MTRCTPFVSAALIAFAMACDGTTTDPDGFLGSAGVAGDYRLTHIAWNASASETPLPAWTFPGRVLVLEGSLTLRTDGRFVSSSRSRLTMFGDTTFVTGADSGGWRWVRRSTIEFLRGSSPAPEALVGSGVVLLHAGGIGSGGTVFRYQRR